MSTDPGPNEVPEFITAFIHDVESYLAQAAEAVQPATATTSTRVMTVALGTATEVDIALPVQTVLSSAAEAPSPIMRSTVARVRAWALTTISGQLTLNAVGNTIWAVATAPATQSEIREALDLAKEAIHYLTR